MTLSQPPELLDPLLSSLFDLLHELHDALPPLTIGGGFGLYLKRRRLERSGDRTLIDPALWPAIRSTNDLDVLLRAEVLADSARVSLLVDVLDRLGYTPVKGAEYMQFVRMIRVDDQEYEVKIDLLVGPFEPFRRLLKVTPPRVRPKAGKAGQKDRLHAHETPEAVGVEDEPLSIPIEGRRTTGEAYQARVCLPRRSPTPS